LGVDHHSILAADLCQGSLQSQLSINFFLFSVLALSSEDACVETALDLNIGAGIIKVLCTGIDNKLSILVADLVAEV
jgi:hypothetical protein